MRGTALGCAVGVLSLSGTAVAVRQPDHLAGRDAFEVAAGPGVRAGRDLVWDRVPRGARAPWLALVDELGPGVRAVWDPALGVPSRVWFPGVDIPGSVSSPLVAEREARAFLQRHLALLAPGASIQDFDLVADDLSSGMRTVGFAQRHRGLAVLGGQVSFRFKNDRLFMIASEALPHVGVTVPKQLVSVVKAHGAAQQWLLSDVAGTAKATGVEGPMILPLVGPSDVRYAVVLRVVVETDPIGRWDVYVDARDGAPVAREQTLRFANGTVLYNAPERWPGDARLDYPASYAALTVEGLPVTSDANGNVTWATSAPTSVVVAANGDQVFVNNAAGGEATDTLALSPAGQAIWNASSSETIDAQLTTFVHTNKVIDYARSSFAQGLPYLDTQVAANVNIDNACNAFYDGNSINFYLSSSNCGNTGQIADVVYHEFGHSLHAESIIEGVGEFEGALSEGVSDFLSVTITGDPAMGRGFFKSSDPLRQIDPPSMEHVWPDDIGEIHYTGLIIGGALWDLRKLLVTNLGESAGVAATNHIYYEAMRRAVDIPTMYFEALAADDDDGDVTNGTPNVCAINEAFGAHGLRRIMAEANDLSVQPPFLEGYEVLLKLIGLYAQCPGDAMSSAQLEWRLREDPSTGGILEMQFSPDGFVATIPPPEDGTVVQYQVRLTFGSGGNVTYPDNPADPWYEMFVGHVEPIYCTDFETDPAADGWTHGLTSGTQQEGADDWQWGIPYGKAGSGDPREAYSGDNVYGNDLGDAEYNGQYQPDKVNYALSPAITITDYDVVRLQYRRWLNIEDAFFDRASIYADDVPVWQNLDSMMGNDSGTHHTDREWRFHDVYVSEHALDGTLQLKWELSSDGGLELGGWTVDDVCVVGWVPTVCGDEKITGIEECDNGDANSNTEADACRENCLAAHCGDEVLDTGEACDGGEGCEADCTVSPDAASTSSGGAPPPPFEVDEGCGCRTPGGRSHQGWLAALALVLVSRLRRRADRAR